MVLQSTLSKATATGNGSTTDFTLACRVVDASHVKVYVNDVLQTISTHYIITTTLPANSITVRFNSAPASAAVVFIKRLVPLTQLYDYVENSKFSSSSHENSLDGQMMATQQIDESGARALKFGLSSAFSDVTFPELTGNANKSLVVNASADGILWETTPAATLLDAKGDLLAASADNQMARVGPVGSDGAYLKADSGASAGVSWATLPVTSYTNTGDNRVLTSGGTTVINGESALTFDGTTLVSPRLQIANDGLIGSAGDVDAMTISSAGIVTVKSGMQFNDDIQLIFGSSPNSDIAMKYDESTGDALAIGANLDVDFKVHWYEDQHDDAGDGWEMKLASHVMTWGNDIASKNTYVTHFSITPNSTVANSTAAFLGKVTAATSVTAPSFVGALTGNASTATALATGRTIGMTGDVVWTSASFDGSGNVTGVATIQANSVALGTDTVGNYVGTVTAGTGLTSTGATSGEGIAHSLSVDAAQTQITSVGALAGLTTTGGSSVFNSTAGDYDFTVVTPNIAKMIFVDGGNETVSIGGTAYTSSTPLTVTGTARSVSNARELITIFDDTSVADAVGSGIIFGGRYEASTNLTEFSSIWAEKENSTSGQYGAELKLGTRPHGGGITTALTISSAQNVEFAGDLSLDNAAGPALLNEAATSSNPTCIVNRADPDTGAGWQAADNLSLIAGGTEAVRISATTTTMQGLALINGSNLKMGGGSSPSLLNETASATNVTICPLQSDEDSGLGAAAANQLSLISGGSEALRMTSSSGQILFGPSGGWTFEGANALRSTNAAGPLIQMGEAATSSNPTLIPNRADPSTGAGWQSSSNLSLVAGGTEAMRMSDARILALVRHEMLAGIHVHNISDPGVLVGAIIISARDSSAGSADSTLALNLETAPISVGSFTASHKIPIWINNTEYHIQLDAV